jgi:hypothetical protein
MQLIARCAAMALFMLSAVATADAPQSITISALRNPVDKSYRKMLDGVALFERMHPLAPQATLRFELLPRKRDTDMADIPLHIVGERFKARVAVAADHTFVLARYPQALTEDAVVRSERPEQTLTWRAEVRTLGLPAHTRRLGDLRLECLVGMEAGLVSRYPSLLGRLFDALESPSEYCGRARSNYLFFAERPLFAVTLRAGARRQTLSVAQLYADLAHGRTTRKQLPYCDCEVLVDRAYTLPLGDKSWPNDTLVEFDYMDAAGADDAHLAGTSKADIAAEFGTPIAVRFDGGYEVWTYETAREQPFEKSEFVLLFSPAGVVTQSRLRPAPG